MLFRWPFNTRVGLVEQTVWCDLLDGLYATLHTKPPGIAWHSFPHETHFLMSAASSIMFSALLRVTIVVCLPSCDTMRSV